MTSRPEDNPYHREHLTADSVGDPCVIVSTVEYPKLVINRIVHYTSHGTPPNADGDQVHASHCRPGIVTQVGAWVIQDIGEEYTHLPGARIVEQENAKPGDGPLCREVVQRYEPDAAMLMITNPTGLFFNTCLHDQDGRAGGTWHWPMPDCNPV